MPIPTRKTEKRTRVAPCDGDIASLIADTSLGPLLVATTERGICAAIFAETRKELEEQQQRRFSARRRSSELANGLLLDRLREAVQWVDSPRCGPGLFVTPIDIDPQGTPFQSMVWQALLTIPIGQTKTYAEVARQIGSPSAVRAVANACGANPVAVLIPCHRVIRSGGGLGGYRWGLARKRMLLQREAELAGKMVQSAGNVEALPKSKTAC